MTGSDVLTSYQRHISTGLASLYRLLGLGDEVRAKGSRVWSSHGESYLDLGGFGVFLLGHGNPDVVTAVQACLLDLPLSSRAMANPWTARAAALLAQTAGDGLGKVMFANSGAEAIEFAMKAAVKATGRRSFVALEGAFHGKTMAALSLTFPPHYRHGWEHVLQPVRHFPPGDDGSLFTFLGSKEAAALFVEPIQSEGGVVPVDPAWLMRAAQAAHASGTVVVVDEVSTGCGRTGRFWCSETSDLLMEVDILVAGKALGGGVMPIAAVLARPEIFEPFDRDPLLHTSTFAGNPLACAAAAATINALDARCLAEIRRKGRLLADGLKPLVGRWPLVSVRGAGLLLGLEFSSPGACGLVTHELLQHHVLTVPALGNIKTLRLTPPAVIADEDIKYFLDALEQSMASAEKHSELLTTMED